MDVSPRGRVLLISANTCTTPEPVFPLGLAHLHTALRRAGYFAQWADLLFQAELLRQLLTEFRPDFIVVSIRNVDDVQINKRELFTRDLNQSIAEMRLAHCPIIVGGSGFSIFPGELLEQTGADYGIIGAGERPLVSLIEALRAKRSVSHIPGLVFRQNGRVHTNAPERTEAVQTVAASDRPAGVVRYYLEHGGMLNLQTQRGCSHRCCYCTYPLLEGPRPMQRPADEVVDEFEQIKSAGAQYAFIVDSVFNSSPDHVQAVCEELLSRSVGLKWGCFLRPQGLTRDLMRLMARAGLAHIEFGCDSFCEKVLQEYGKHLTFDDIQESTLIARDVEVDFCHFVIAGGPGETPETLEEGYNNALVLGPAMIMALPGMRIYPGTPLQQRAIREGYIREGQHLLTPIYYLSRSFSLQSILEQLRGFARRSPNWIVGDSHPAYEELVKRLRSRGVKGPLWSYFSAVQRLWPIDPRVEIGQTEKR